MLDNVGLLKDRRQVTSAIFPTLFWRHPIRHRCLGRRQRSKMSNVKRLFCVSVYYLIDVFSYIIELTLSVCVWRWSYNSLHGSSWWYRWCC